MVSRVEGVTWELSGTLYQWVFPFAVPIYGWYVIGRKLFSGESSQRPPERIIHVAIVFHGHVYEYCDEGVRKTIATDTGDPGSVCSVHKFLERKSLGNSSVSLGQFDSWVAENKNGRYAKEKYCVAKNNCIHFAMEAARYLGVGYPMEWPVMLDYTENHPTICKLANGSTGSSSSST